MTTEQKNEIIAKLEEATRANGEGQYRVANMYIQDARAALYGMPAAATPPAPASDEVLARIEAELAEYNATELMLTGRVPSGAPESYVYTYTRDVTALLARVRQAEAPRPWLPTTDMPAVPEGQTVRLWVCIEGKVSELLYGYRVDMDENWDDDPYTGWFEEGDDDGMPVYHGPLPTHYKEQEPAPAAPTVKGGQQDA